MRPRPVDTGDNNPAVYLHLMMNTVSAAVALAIQTTANVAFDTYNSYIQKKTQNCIHIYM